MEKIQVGHLATCSSCGKPMVTRMTKKGSCIVNGKELCHAVIENDICTECLSEKDTCYNSKSET